LSVSELVERLACPSDYAIRAALKRLVAAGRVESFSGTRTYRVRVHLTVSDTYPATFKTTLYRLAGAGPA
jgi:hypothetical protein